jgi:iduronate 2-sulfatase
MTILKPVVNRCRIGMFLLVLISQPAFSQTTNKKYNILFIASDDLNTDMGSYRHPKVKTPNFDRLAKRGVLFNRAYCQYPLCNPSRSSVLTGKNPDEIKVYDLTTHFRSIIPDIITLPQHFKNNGYYVARVGKLFHYNVPSGIGTNGLDDSLSWTEVRNPKGRDKTDQKMVTNLSPERRELGSSLSYLIADGSDEEQTDGMVATEAINLMKEHQNESFFLGIGFFRPHTPFVAPKKYFDIYPLSNISLPTVPANDLDDIPSAAIDVKPLNFGLSEEKQKEAIRGYYAAISFMDAQLGRILDALDSLHLADNTIIVFWSDHGFNLGQHGQWMKKSLFENSARIPLVISVPGGLKGKISNRTVSLIDLYPTLTDLCGVPVTQKLSGASLRPLLKNPREVWDRPAFTQVVRNNKIIGRSIRTERWRYTEWDEGKAGRELYDEINDKDEIINLADNKEYTDIVKDLSVKLKENYSQDAKKR